MLVDVHVKASIYMPALRVLRNIVDRMKNLSNFVRVSANNSGELKLCVETDLVTVSTYFHDLDRPVWREYHCFLLLCAVTSSPGFLQVGENCPENVREFVLSGKCQGKILFLKIQGNVLVFLHLFRFYIRCRETDKQYL